MPQLGSLRTRLIVVIAVVVIVVCGILAAFSLSQQEQLTELAIDREMRSAYQSVMAAIDYERRTFQALAALTGADPDVRAAFAARDRERLLAATKDGFDAIRSSFGYDIMQFTLPPAINFLRVH